MIAALTNLLLPSIESELKRQISRLDQPLTKDFYEMLTYHMGWTGEDAGQEAQGKRIRPLLLLLTCASTSGITTLDHPLGTALPAAACLELIHNFSLVHDDIQDRSETRRGRPTVWRKWGEAQAINVGDALFVLAHLALGELEGLFPPEVILKGSGAIHNTCLDLTRGQYLDIAYEMQSDLTIESYWPMIAGKTAALLSACTHIGALLGNADEDLLTAYKDFGHYLGLAFQIQDDFLGIWGDVMLSGKSNKSDLTSGKKSLPVLYGLSRKGAFAQRWMHAKITPAEVPVLAEQLAREGAKTFTQETADQMMNLATRSLRLANPQGEAGEALFELTHKLLGRGS
jgi:geranylgeranyl diphosphate synthase type I